ncbi:NTP transferase domain-containing protein [Methanosphaera sp. ISO3-F5]|uniref:nucleotidyltransferase family protein n=1 Tax=Methanosphaera sp. ISO3-F5 TaxID=1452353 RepID=UPI002B25BB86|nr:NTP transferase domain-containing protein [Methanosphaera sp. ISO3-F5]WQH64417.1 NTP transferase domain-containing protein [Methanosphaera sp. ISO3-F5]
MDAIVTAAGKNSRMINDFKKMNKKPVHKLRLELNNKPILVHTLEKIFASEIEEVTVCLGHHKEEILNILREYSLEDKVNISINENPEVGLSKTIENALKNGQDKYYLYAAADQPTLTTKTINNMIKVLRESEHPENTISILRRRKTGKLDTAEGLGMPFCCYGKLLYRYIYDKDDNLNPILREMIKDNVEFYAIKEENELELLNINHYEEYLKIKKTMG